MLPDPLREYLDRSDKSSRGKVLSVIAKLSDKSGFEKAVETVESALSHNASDTDSLLNLHSLLNTQVALPKPIKLALNVPELKKYIPELSAYDAALSKAGDR